MPQNNLLNEARPVARFLVLSAAFVVVIAGMRAAESLLVPFLLSLFIAVIFSPPLAWLKKRGVPNGLAIVLVIGVIVIAGIAVGAVVGSSVKDFQGSLPEYRASLSENVNSVIAMLASKGVPIDQEQIRQIVNPGVALGLVGDTLLSFSVVMGNAFMILLITIFILAEEVGFSDKFRFAYRDSEKTLGAIQQFTHGVNQYIAIKSALSLLTGFLVYLWLLFIGVDYPVLWGLLAFLLNFIPTLGSILAAVPAVMLAFVQPGLGPVPALLTGLGYLLVNVGVGNVIEPKLMGKGLGLSALVVFFSLVFWNWVLGPVGMLLSIPLTMTVKIALESFPDTRWIGVMLGSGKQVTMQQEEEEKIQSMLAAIKDEPKKVSAGDSSDASQNDDKNDQTDKNS